MKKTRGQKRQVETSDTPTESASSSSLASSSSASTVVVSKKLKKSPKKMSTRSMRVQTSFEKLKTLKSKPPQVVVEELIPFQRSRMYDERMFEYLTEDFAEEFLAENVQDELYDILGGFSLQLSDRSIRLTN